MAVTWSEMTCRLGDDPHLMQMVCVQFHGSTTGEWEDSAAREYYLQGEGEAEECRVVGFSELETRHSIVRGVVLCVATNTGGRQCVS